MSTRASALSAFGRCKVLNDVAVPEFPFDSDERCRRGLCIEFLAKKLGVAKSSVAIIAGMKSRHKTIRVTGITSEQVLSLIE